MRRGRGGFGNFGKDLGEVRGAGSAGAGGGLTPSELLFKGLDRNAIVNEDVKFQLASSLEMMLKELEKSMDSQRKKR